MDLAILNYRTGEVLITSISSEIIDSLYFGEPIDYITQPVELGGLGLKESDISWMAFDDISCLICNGLPKGGLKIDNRKYQELV